ncbi:hypothetical protein [Ornithinimicrobium kibberense]|uniref:hypothetical protein n=1 Tax=Ornithinimicrobium kibberense TaxID=282060 RepID=UPI00361B82E3
MHRFEALAWRQRCFRRNFLRHVAEVDRPRRCGRHLADPLDDALEGEDIGDQLPPDGWRCLLVDLSVRAVIGRGWPSASSGFVQHRGNLNERGLNLGRHAFP